VKKVIRNVDTFDRAGEVLTVGGVTIDDLDLVDPRMEPQALGVARHDTDAITVGEQFSDEPSTDVPGCASYEAQGWQSTVTPSQGEV
jgi:hypothetical protein